MTVVSYAFDEDPRSRFGLIVLQVDETIEDDFRKLLPQEHVRLHVSRIPSGAELTPETIRQMEHDLPRAAGLLPPDLDFDVVAYACTSGTTLIGADRVEELVQSHCKAKAVTDPFTATIAAVKTLGLQKLGIVSPYIPSVSDTLRNALKEKGVYVSAMVSFGEETESKVARISQNSMKDAARHLADQADLDGVFLSCTNLRTLDIIDALEAELNLPVLSSNQTLAWHMAQFSSRNVFPTGPGRLFTS